MDQNTARVFELNELIRFYAQVASTEGMDSTVVENCNTIINSLLPKIKDIFETKAAKDAGLILGHE